MGEKKKKEESSKKLKKILVVIACAFFAAVMVISSMGSQWIGGIRPIQAGDTVVLDYTIFDSFGNPVATTNQQLWTQTLKEGKGILLAKQISMAANQSAATTVVPISVYSQQNGWDNSFAMFNSEYNMISQGIVGMKDGDKKNITMPGAMPMVQTWPAASLARQNISISTLRVGDQLAMGVSENQSAIASNNTGSSYIRLAEITNISSDGIAISFGYPVYQVTIASVNGR